MTKPLTWRDRGWDALKGRIAEAHGSTVTVGVQGERAEAAEGGVTMAQLASIHEFGAPGANIPERSFMRQPVYANEKKYRGILRRIASAIMLGRMDADSGLGLLGEQVMSDVKTRIESNIPPKLEPETIARKEKRKARFPSLALVDTGRLKDAITWTVHKVGGAAALFFRPRDVRGRYYKR